MIKAKKSLGQNFLIDQNIINKIVNLVNIKNKNILEIGPGTGNLTSKLINQLPKKLTVIEKDNKLANLLKKNLGTKISIINDDILKLDENKIENEQLTVFGNLPYNISSPLIIKLLPILKKTNCMVFLLQKEVVDRLAASPNTKQYGRLSIITQYFCDVTPLTEIPPEAFSPAPKVQSQLVKFNNPKENKFDVILKDISSLEKVTQIAFNQRRKQIKTSLKPLFSEEQIIKLNINPKLRAENLEIEDYIRLSNLI